MNIQGGNDTPGILHRIGNAELKDGYRSLSITANYTITDIDKIKTLFVPTGASNYTVTLPTAADNLDRVLEIIKVDSGAGSVVIDGEGAETINGNAGVTIYNQYAGIRIKCNGTGWYITDLIGSHEITYTSTGAVAIAGATSGTWYNPASHSITIPTGRWRIEYFVCIGVSGAASTFFGCNAALATTGVVPLADFRSFYTLGPSATLGYVYVPLSNFSYVSLASATTYSLIIMGSTSGALSTLTTAGNTATTKIIAKRVM